MEMIVTLSSSFQNPATPILYWKEKESDKYQSDEDQTNLSILQITWPVLLPLTEVMKLSSCQCQEEAETMTT